MKKPSFSKLKANYKTLPTQIHSCSMSFPNTCAIRMSEALVKTDSSFLDAFQNSSKNKCPLVNMTFTPDPNAVPVVLYSNVRREVRQ
ncbi:hypothetical protein OLZ68_004231 [Vibrio vulnificus]|nr:hypothetical protein [Vibrio vulnificus]